MSDFAGDDEQVVTSRLAFVEEGSQLDVRLREMGCYMAKGFEGLVVGDALRAVYSDRSKPDDEKTVSAGGSAALEAKVAAELLDGWRVLRRNRRSVRMAKAKPVDRRLEDDVWSLLCRMGFSELNATRDFVIDIDRNSPPRQIDVFAKDAETVLIVECTHSREQGPKSVKALCDKISAIRDGAIKAIHSHFGKDPRLKVKFAIATRNVEWRKADRDRVSAAGIGIITEDDLAYFEKLTTLLKKAARYQFLGRYMRGEKIEGLRTTIPATKGRAGGEVFYTFLISPHDLLRVAYISHRSKTSNDDIETYQRMVKPARLAEIGRFIDGGGRFPTNIVVNLKTDGPLHFDKKADFDEDMVTGLLHLPGQYGTALIIDGQHRLYGYAHSEREHDRTVVSVLAYENLPIRDEIGMFIDINTKQVKVTRNLVNEVVSSMDIDDEDGFRKLDAMHARVGLELDRLSTSPMRDRILTVSQEKSSTRCLTLTSLADGLNATSLLGTAHKMKGKPAALYPGPLSALSGEPRDTVERAASVLSKYFSLFSTGDLEEHWRTGDGKGGYLCTNLGVRSLMDLLRRFIAHIEIQSQVKAGLLDPGELVDLLVPFVKPVAAFFLGDPDDVAAFRNRGSSLKTVSENTRQMEIIVHEALKANYAPKDVLAYMETRDAQGTKQAKEMIDEINKILFDDVVETLKVEFGAERDAWWVQGVPSAVRTNCDKLFNDDSNPALSRWNFLFLSNYPEIILYKDNWRLFEDRYSFYGRSGKKAERIRWIGRVNRARTVTHHAEKGPLSKADVEYVRRVHELVKRFIEGDEVLNLGHAYIRENATEDIAAVA